MVPLNCRLELDLVKGVALELLARAKLWVTQTQKSVCAVVADLRQRTGELEGDIARASRENLELYTKASLFANKKLVAEVKLKAYAKGRQNAAEALAVKRMQRRELQLAWSTWVKMCTVARRVAVAQGRLLDLVMLCCLASAWDRWRDAVRAAGRERRAAAFAVAKVNWRAKVLLQRWRSAAGDIVRVVQAMTTRATMAELRARSKCQKLLAVFRVWQALRDARPDSSSISVNLSKIFSY